VRLAWLVLLVLSLGLYLMRQVLDGPYGKDFTMFLTGAHLLLDGRAPELYSISAQTAVQHALSGPVTYPGGVLPFNYPPYVAALFVPLASFPADVAYYVWLAVQWVVLVGWAVWVLRSFRRWGEGTPGLLLLSVFCFAPIIEALLMGQMSLVLLVLWWWAFVSWREGKDTQLGVAVALAAFKPQMALLLVVALVAQKKWRALAFVAIAQTVLWVGAFLMSGPGIFTSYIDMLRMSASSTGTLGFYPEAMPNLRGLLTIAGVPTDASFWLATIGWLLSLVVVFLLWWRSSGNFAARFGFTILLAVLFSPHLYIHDAALLFLAVICAALVEAEKPERIFVPLYPAFALPFLSIYAVVRSYVPVILSIWLLGVILVVLLAQPSWRTMARAREVQG
jgi:hypothetical protein